MRRYLGSATDYAVLAALLMQGNVFSLGDTGRKRKTTKVKRILSPKQQKQRLAAKCARKSRKNTKS